MLVHHCDGNVGVMLESACKKFISRSHINSEPCKFMFGEIFKIVRNDIIGSSRYRGCYHVPIIGIRQ